MNIKKTGLLMMLLIIMLCSCASENADKDQTDSNKAAFYQDILAEHEPADLEEYQNAEGESRLVTITFEECADILDSGTGIIYIGSAACAWCQRAVPELNSAALKEDVYILYADSSQSFLKSQYDRICEKLKEYLENGELKAPTVVAVENGVIKGYHKGTVESFHLIDDSNWLNDEQKEALQNIYRTMIKSIAY